MMTLFTLLSLFYGIPCDLNWKHRELLVLSLIPTMKICHAFKFSAEDHLLRLHWKPPMAPNK